MRTFLKAIFWIPLAVIGIAFAVANRQAVTISLDPFTNDPVLAFRQPLFIDVFAFIMAGVIIGGIATWIGQGRYRAAARRAQAEADELRAENSRLRTELDIHARRMSEARTTIPALAHHDLG